LLPGQAGEGRVRYRVTTNQITSQVVGTVIRGMHGLDTATAVDVQLGGVDSLEPAYPCPAAAAGYDAIKSLDNAVWKAHLDAARGLYAELDEISGVARNDTGFHIWMDHYYDNLSARECHAKPLPCKLVGGRNSTTCVDREMADGVYRLGQWEYSRLYRDEEEGFRASVGSMGVWIAEVSAHLRDVVEGRGGQVVYRHNVAHDGSLSRVLSVLQIEEMVWPGMGSEVVFELYEKVGKGEDCGSWYVRVLFGGRTLTSSNPSLGRMEMVPVETLLGYFDGLVGVNAGLVVGKCNGTIAA
jgi:acid phosphatase